MKKIFTVISLLVCANLGFISCTNELNEPENEAPTRSANNETALSDTITEPIKFLYKGITYEATSTVVNDSVISIDNMIVKDLLLGLDKLPNLVTFSYPDGSYEYFDNQEDFNANKPRAFKLSEEIEKTLPRVPQTRGRIDSPNYNYAANLFLHDDRNYEDTMCELNLPIGQAMLAIDHLKPTYGMNDKTSSFVAISINGSTLFELFEDDNYRNHCFSLLVTKTTNIGINSGERSIPQQHGLAAAPNLKNVHVVGTKRSSWNDRITSIRMTRQ